MKETYKDFWNFSIGRYTTQLANQTDFYKMLATSAGGVRDFVYMPLDLIPQTKQEHKITRVTFSDCSFAKTHLQNIEFYSCKFVNCKFNLSKFTNCKFHDCDFNTVNMSFVEVTNSYLDPDFFGSIIPNYRNFSVAVQSANMCVTFFQTLYHNAKDTGQEEHKKNADYHFQKWKGLNYLQKRFTKQPYSDKITWSEFLKKYPLNLFQYLVTGYGYRVTNFLFTFILVFCFFGFKNYTNWTVYDVEKRDVEINSFKPDSSSIETTFYYTLDATTKLIDSQMQPKSMEGMLWLSLQGVVGFILLSCLITIILNKFVK